MEKGNYSQLELFSRSGDYSNIRTQTSHHSFLGRIRNNEKTILGIIAFVITAIISFSLGVEKGKRAQLINTGSRIDMALKTQSAVSVKTTSKPRIQPTQEKQETIKQPAFPQNLHNYTIQVASFKSRSLAQKETEKIKKLGFKPLTFSRGKFAVIYVGNFPDKKTAEPTLSKLKKRYGDCIIRRL